METFRKFHRAAIRRHVVLLDLEAHLGRVGVPPSRIVHCHHERVERRAGAGDGAARSVVKVAMPHWRGR